MSEPFVAEVRIFAGNFAPRGWALCNGQLLPIAQNTALFALIGTIYGGDGRTTCALPNLQGRVPVHPGTGPGLTQRRLGETGGTEQVMLTVNQTAAHTHNLRCTSSEGNQLGPAGNVLAAEGSAYTLDYAFAEPNATMHAGSITGEGGGQSHSNVQPFLVLNFIIALTGLFPSRD